MTIYNLGSRIVNQYLYSTGKGYVLVDTGYEPGYARFRAQLEKRGIPLESIGYLFLTHAHDDHAGFLNRLLTDHPTLRVVLSEQALPVLYRGQNSFEGGCTGRSALAFCMLMKLLGRGAHRFPPMERRFETRCLPVSEENRAEIEQALGGSVFSTPGHTADSISLLLRDGTLFCGDAAMNGFPSVHHLTIWAENREAYPASWETLLALRPKILCPGHGAPFSPEALSSHLDYARRISLYPLSPPKEKGRTR